MVAGGFALAGAWLVFPFAGLELLALGYAFHVMRRHAGDYESITIDGDRLRVEKRDGRTVSQTEFHCYWAHVVLDGVARGTSRLWLRSHGRSVEVGRYLTHEARLELAGQLRKRIGAGDYNNVVS